MVEYRIRLEPLGVEFNCAEGQTVLEAAEAHGIIPLFGCRGGRCGSCKSQVVDGEVDYGDEVPWALMDDEIEAGMGLLCIGIPRSDLVVEVDEALFSIQTQKNESAHL